MLERWRRIIQIRDFKIGTIIEISIAGDIIRTVSIQATVIDTKNAETAVSFLTFRDADT